MLVIMFYVCFEYFWVLIILYFVVFFCSSTKPVAGIVFSGYVSRCPLTSISHETRSLYLVEEFQWNLPQIFILWVGIALNVSRLEVKGQGLDQTECHNGTEWHSSEFQEATESSLLTMDHFFVSSVHLELPRIGLHVTAPKKLTLYYFLPSVGVPEGV